MQNIVTEYYILRELINTDLKFTQTNPYLMESRGGGTIALNHQDYLDLMLAKQIWFAERQLMAYVSP